MPHLLRGTLCLWQEMHVTLLPVYAPDADERADPELYAHNVRRTMAAALGVPLSNYDAKKLNAEYYGT